MTGITGLINLADGVVSETDLRPALKRLSIYGTDWVGEWHQGAAAFASQVQFVTPESKYERQPLTMHDCTIAADARIDNRDELTRELGISSPEAAQTPDSQLILLAYLKWGDQCAARLIGDFAFAIWDAKQQTLFCARDHVGMRPFYYFYDQRVFAFSSDLEAITQIQGVTDRLDEAEIERYLFSLNLPYYTVGTTFLANVRKLLPAHTLTLTRGSEPRITQYWYPEHIKPASYRTPQECAEQLLHVVETAVRDRIRTEYPVGAHFSGGVDSSLLAVLAQRLLRQSGRGIKGFSWSQPVQVEEETKEYKRIRAIAQMHELDVHYVPSSERAVMDMVLEADLATRPIVSLVREHVLQRLAAQDGMRVLVSGWGGDETVSYDGRGYWGEMFITGRWLELYRNLRPRATKGQSRLSILKTVAHGFWHNVVLMGLSDRLRSRLQNSLIYKIPSDRFIRADYQKKLDNPQVPTMSFSTWGSRRAMIRSYYSGYLAQRIESWAWSGAESSLQYAYPFLDRRVMEFAYSLPGSMYVHDGWSRYIIRLAAQNLFPPTMSWDGYGGFKNETMLMQLPVRSPEEIAFHQQQRQALLERTRDNPWIDVDRLQKQLSNETETTPEDSAMAHKAIHVTRMWDYWKQRQ